MPVLFNNSDITKKGKSDGNTTFSHRFTPFSAELTAVSEKNMRQRIKRLQTAGSKRLFMYITLLFFNLTSSMGIKAKNVKRIYFINFYTSSNSIKQD